MTGTNARTAGYDPQGKISTRYIATESRRHRAFSRGIYCSMAGLALSFVYWVAMCCYYGDRHITISQGSAYLMMNATPMAISTVLAYTFFALRSEWRFYRYNKVIGTISTITVGAATYWYLVFAYFNILH